MVTSEFQQEPLNPGQGNLFGDPQFHTDSQGNS